MLCYSSLIYLINIKGMRILLWAEQLHNRKLLLILVLLQEIVRLRHKEGGIVRLRDGRLSSGYDHPLKSHNNNNYRWVLVEESLLLLDMLLQL